MTRYVPSTLDIVTPSPSLSEGLAFEPPLLAKFAVATCELLEERMRDMSRRV